MFRVTFTRLVVGYQLRCKDIFQLRLKPIVHTGDKIDFDTVDFVTVDGIDRA